MALITLDEAAEIRDELLPLFSSVEAYEASMRHFREKFPRPTASQFRRWMLEDLEVDRAMRGATPAGDSLLPVRQNFDLSDCRHCGGYRFLRADVPVEHPDFGRAIRCEFCPDFLEKSGKSHEKSACEICKKPRVLGGYVGPEIATVPADWEPGTSIPDDWQPVHGGHR
jgi:hypothetical protein